MSIYAIVVAGGSGQRMGMEENKVLVSLRGVPAIVRAIAPFSALCQGVVLVARQEEQEQMRGVLRKFGLERLLHAVVSGGEDRQASVANGLLALPEDADMVLVHDGARALVTEDVIERVIASVEKNGTGIAAVPVTDTVKQADAEGRVLVTLDRAGLYAMQTPQGFEAALLRSAHQRAEAEGYRATDDAALLERAGSPVYLCEGDRENIKLTTPFDVTLAEAILAKRAERAVQ